MPQSESLRRTQLFWIKSESLPIMDQVWQFPHLDMGLLVAEELTRKPPGKYVSIEIDTFLRTTLRTSLADQTSDPKGLVLKNLGILLEPDLELNSVNLFMELSKEAMVILVWDYTILDGVRFVWDEAVPGYGFLFPSHTITQLELPHEVP